MRAQKTSFHHRPLPYRLIAFVAGLLLIATASTALAQPLPLPIPGPYRKAAMRACVRHLAGDPCAFTNPRGVTFSGICAITRRDRLRCHPVGRAW